MGCPELTIYDYFTDVEAKPKSADRRNANKNITELLDDTGTVRAHYEYSPFGKITAMSGDKAADNPFRFSSEYHDDGTALVYYNFRYYSPELGRWTKRDDIGYVDTYNLYTMIANESINWFDYLGREGIDGNGRYYRDNGQKGTNLEKLRYQVKTTSLSSTAQQNEMDDIGVASWAWQMGSEGSQVPMQGDEHMESGIYDQMFMDGGGSYVSVEGDAGDVPAGEVKGTSVVKCYCDGKPGCDREDKCIGECWINLQVSGYAITPPGMAQRGWKPGINDIVKGVKWRTRGRVKNRRVLSWGRCPRNTIPEPGGPKRRENCYESLQRKCSIKAGRYAYSLHYRRDEDDGRDIPIRPPLPGAGEGLPDYNW